MGNTDRKLAAHLARRAGFGATPDELDFYESFVYEDLVDHFLDPRVVDHVADDLIYRRHPNIHAQLTHNPMYWAYRMLTTNSPMREKIALFWHGIFATAEPKINNFGAINNQINMFRDRGLGKFDKILVELSKDPAMIVWLDNQTNHKNEINENYGREILELFSMGVGNYTEQDVKECARAFTGWTIENSEYMALMGAKDSIWPYGRIFWHFQYDDNDHDNGEKTFLGETGRFNGEDIIKIICKQDATAQFVSRHLYNYFVADEVPVPQWGHVPAKDPYAIDALAKAYRESEYSIKETLRVLFNSDFFKRARFTRIKSPAEFIVNTLRCTAEFHVIDGSDNTVYQVMEDSGFMGQKLTNPPSVEGWHTGEEWITSGSLVDRVNFASKYITDTSNPGVENMISRVTANITEKITPAQFLDACVSVLGELELSGDTYDALLTVTEHTFSVDGTFTSDPERLITKVFQIISSSKEFQLC
jgi:uncharacterized protein (DUF1800 family)